MRRIPPEVRVVEVELLPAHHLEALKELVKRARVTQIMNLLRLSDEMREFLLGLDDPSEIRWYSERRLRG